MASRLSAILTISNTEVNKKKKVTAEPADCHKQDLGSIGIVGNSKPFVEKRRHLPTDLLWPVQMPLQTNLIHIESIT